MQTYALVDKYPLYFKIESIYKNFILIYLQNNIIIRYFFVTISDFESLGNGLYRYISSYDIVHCQIKIIPYLVCKESISNGFKINYDFLLKITPFIKYITLEKCPEQIELNRLQILRMPLTTTINFVCDHTKLKGNGYYYKLSDCLPITHVLTDKNELIHLSKYRTSTKIHKLISYFTKCTIVDNKIKITSILQNYIDKNYIFFADNINNPILINKNGLLCDKCENIIVIHPKLFKIEYDTNLIVYIIKSQKNSYLFEKDLYVPLKNINNITISKSLKELPINNHQNMYNHMLLCSVYSPDKYYLEKEYDAENVKCMYNCILNQKHISQTPLTFDLPYTAFINTSQIHVVSNNRVFFIEDYETFIGTGAKTSQKIQETLQVFKNTNEVTNIISTSIEDIKIVRYKKEFYYNNEKITPIVHNSYEILQIGHDNYVFFPNRSEMIKINKISQCSSIYIDNKIYYRDYKRIDIYTNAYTSENYIVLGTRMINLVTFKNYPVSTNFFTQMTDISECDVRCTNTNIFVNNASLNLEFIDIDFVAKGYQYNDHIIFSNNNNIYLIQSNKITSVRPNQFILIDQVCFFNDKPFILTHNEQGLLYDETYLVFNQVCYNLCENKHIVYELKENILILNNNKYKQLSDEPICAKETYFMTDKFNIIDDFSQLTRKQYDFVNLYFYNKYSEDAEKNKVTISNKLEFLNANNIVVSETICGLYKKSCDVLQFKHIYIKEQNKYIKKDSIKAIDGQYIFFTDSLFIYDANLKYYNKNGNSLDFVYDI